jgi:hypothetical protein
MDRLEWPRVLSVLTALAQGGPTTVGREEMATR